MSRNSKPVVVGPMAAHVLLEWLEDNPEWCVAIEGRIGALPHYRYRDGDWQLASAVGPPGEVITGTTDRQDIKEAIQEGPTVKLFECDEIRIWGQAHRENDLRKEWTVNPLD